MKNEGLTPKVFLEKESHLLEVSRYVVLNPVRAKAVTHPGQWRWSSYRATAGKEKPHACLTTEWILGQFGRRRRHAEKKYREFVDAGIAEGKLWEQVKGQSILGEEVFVETLLGYVKGLKDIKEIPKSQRYLKRPGLNEIFSGSPMKNKPNRGMGILEAIESHGYSQKEVADYLGLHYSTVSRLSRKRNNDARNKTQDLTPYLQLCVWRLGNIKTDYHPLLVGRGFPLPQ
jgi:putative transposase